jgi:hypothetical protein
VSAARADTSAAAAPRWLGALPAGFVLETQAGACCVMRSDWAARLRAAGYGARGLAAAAALTTHSSALATDSATLTTDSSAMTTDSATLTTDSSAMTTDSSAALPAGRRPLLELRAGDARLLLRRHTHGGLLRWITGSRFWDPRRPFRELYLARELELRGLPVAPVLAARAARRAGGGYELELLSLRIAPALDLGELLDAQQAGRASPASRPSARRALFEALGELVARMHAQGLAHADLQPKNLLLALTPSAERGAAPLERPRLWILDLDRSRLQPALSAASCVANWSRLERALEKRGQQALVSRAERGRVLRAYARARDTSPRVADALDWRALWRRIEARGHCTRWWHRAAWSAERGLVRAPSSR